MLSIKCPNCGGTVQFDENHIATFCSFCGSHLPDMTDYVKKSADLEIEQKRHKMVIETLDKDIEKEKQTYNAEHRKNIIALIALAPFIIIAFIAIIRLIQLI